jgi:cytochrome c553
MLIWLKQILLSVIAMAAIFVGYVYLASYWQMQQQFPAQQRHFKVANDANLEEGQRLATIRGCYNDCHGKGATGQDFYGLHAPNLTVLVKEYSDEELEQVIRQGVRPDGTSVYSMSSDAFQYLSDSDLSDIIGFLRSLPTAENPADRHNPSFSYRWQMLNGAHEPVASNIKQLIPVAQNPINDSLALGKYLAMSTCVECHGTELQGEANFTPGLIISRAYQQSEFTTLMSSGMGRGYRQLGLMSLTATERFSHFNQQEIDALFDYLQSDEFMALTH